MEKSLKRVRSGMVRNGKDQMEEKKKRTAEDYYKVAEKFYRLKRFILCRNYALKALRMDPNLWKACSL